MSASPELEASCAIALEAAALVRGYAGASRRVDRKAGGEPVTDADREASALIVARLRRAFPGDAVLSEELPDDGTRLGAPRVWMVDPIDGTRDFIRGDSGFAVMIGLAVGGRPALGVVSQPPTGASWAGEVGRGAWKQDARGARAPIAPSGLRELHGIRLVASKSHRTPEVDRIRAALGIQDEINVGSVGLKVSMVADGSRDLYVYAGDRTKKWDTCAPEAVLLAAGGRLTDTRAALLAYAQPDLRNRDGLVASNGLIHDAVLAALAAIEPLA